MKKKTLIIILIILLLLAGITATVFILRSKNRNSSPYPKLEMTITDYPEVIETQCQRFDVVVSARNTGTKDLQYSDIESGEYEFILLADDLEIASTSTSDYYLTVSDFGVIKKGEIKDITLTPGNHEQVFDDVRFVNHTSRVADGANMKRNLTVSFAKEIDDTRYIQLGVSNPVITNIQILEDPSINLLKSCIE